jgi:hypothetical protein
MSHRLCKLACQQKRAIEYPATENPQSAPKFGRALAEMSIVPIFQFRKTRVSLLRSYPTSQMC